MFKLEFNEIKNKSKVKYDVTRKPNEKLKYVLKICIA